MEQNQSTKKSLNKKHLAITIIIIVVILLAGFWYAYIQQRNFNTISNSMDPRLAELQRLKDSSEPDNSTKQEKLDDLNSLYKSSDTTKYKDNSMEVRLQELNNLSK